MQLKIKDNTVELNFGIRFVKELNKLSPVSSGDMSFGMGLTKAIPAFQAGDPEAFANILYCATFANSPRPSYEEVEDYLDSADVKELDKLSDEVLENLHKSSVVSRAIDKMS